MRVRVEEAWTAVYADPIGGAAGDVLEVGRRDEEWPVFLWCRAADGREGWVPEPFLALDGPRGRLVRDYSARELTVARGDEIRALEEVGGWARAEAPDGRTGWVPVRALGAGVAEREGAGQ